MNAFTLISWFDCIVNLKVFWLVYLLDAFSVIGNFAERWEAEGIRKRDGKTGLFELWHLVLYLIFQT